MSLTLSLPAARPETKPVNVRFPVDDLNFLQNVAKKNGCTVSDVLRALVAEARKR